MESSFISNPENTFNHTHASSIAEHGKHIFCAWYMYEEKEHVKGRICIVKYNPLIRSWSKASDCFPSLVGCSLGNPVIFSADNKLQMFFVKIDTYWDDAQIYYSSLENELTNTWSGPVKVNVAKGLMVRHRPIVCESEIFIPAYDEISMQTVIYKADGDYSKWEEFSKIQGDYIQGDLIKHNDKRWQIILRAAKDNTKVCRSISTDAGKSWGVANATSLPCPLSGIAAVLMSDEKILVCNNHTEEHKRTPISFSLSENAGAVFDIGPYHIDESDFELSYPSLLRDKNNNIHLVYTYKREMIRHLKFSEEEIISKAKG